MHLFEITGWAGFILYLIAYMLLATNHITAGKLYYILNILAAVCITVVSVYKGTVQAVLVNLLWGLISCTGLSGTKIRSHADITAIFRFLIIGLFGTSAVLFVFGQEYWTIRLLAWIYVLAFIISYWLFISHKISVFEFHIWNLVASLTILPKLIVDYNWPVFALEILWALAAVTGLAKNKTTAGAELRFLVLIYNTNLL
jgi:hypothetical protein